MRLTMNEACVMRAGDEGMASVEALDLQIVHCGAMTRVH
jgi:hypothetical protein